VKACTEEDMVRGPNPVLLERHKVLDSYRVRYHPSLSMYWTAETIINVDFVKKISKANLLVWAVTLRRRG